jgi:hypothetical protein
MQVPDLARRASWLADDAEGRYPDGQRIALARPAAGGPGRVGAKPVTDLQQPLAQLMSPPGCATALVAG